MTNKNEWRTILCSGAEHLDEELVRHGIPTARSSTNYDGSRLFANSDVYTRLSNIRRFEGKRVCVLQSMTGSGELDQFKFTTADRIIEILQVLDILKNPVQVSHDKKGNRVYKLVKPPREIIVICLHMAFSKQDQIYRTGELNSSKLIIDLLFLSGAQRVVLIDPHAPLDFPWMKEMISDGRLIIQSMYDHFVDDLRKKKLLDEMYLMSTPGKTRTHLAKEIPEINKTRISTHEVVLVGNATEKLQGKKIFLLDDMVISGTTIKNTRKLLLEQGAAEVFCWITHALPLTSGKEDNLRDLVDEFDGKIYVSNTVRTKTFEIDHPYSLRSCTPLIINYLKSC